jgi:lauroyl/myristoyl acyltransferase
VLGRVIVVAAWVGSRLPARVAHGLAVAGGHVEWVCRPGKRRQLATNLAHAVGDGARSRRVRRLVRAEVVNEARRSADLLWAIGRRAAFLERVEVVGTEHTDAAVARGRGVVLAGIHLGGWEVAVPVPAAVIPAPTTVIVADDWLAWAVHRIREEAGLQVVYRSARTLAPVRVLQRGEVLLVLGDDAVGLPPRRLEVRFCDGVARLPLGIVTLARLAGSPIVPFSVMPLGPRRWRVVIEAPIDAPARHGSDGDEQRVLQELADRWTAQISAHPEHWAARFPIDWVGDLWVEAG